MVENTTYLSEEELLEFIVWCKDNKIKNKDVAKVLNISKQTVSNIFGPRKPKRSRSFKGKANRKTRLLRIRAEKAVEELQKLLEKEKPKLPSFINITDSKL
jgi:predicted transcriptional regulator